jgi:hypothetical protein
MSETKYEVLARMDAAINTMLAMRELYVSTLLQEPSTARDGPPAPTTASAKQITPRQKLIIDAVVELQEWSEWSGNKPTLDSVIEAVWPHYPQGGENARDQRKANAGRDLRDAIAAGHLVQNDDGVVSLPDADGV